MRTIFDYITADWSTYGIPVAVFVVSLIALFWIRKRTMHWLENWSKRINWSVGNTLIPSLRSPFYMLCLILSVYLSLAVSRISGEWKILASDILWSLFVIAITATILSISFQIILFYGRKFKTPVRIINIIQNIVRIVVLVMALLVVLDIWGFPTSPFLLLLAIAVLVAALAFRDTVPNLFASFQIAATQQIKEGDYIKLDSKEEGYISQISWNNTRIEALDGSEILIPNNILIRHKIINYGRPLKQAKTPFQFNTRVYIPELTGLKAKNLRELIDILKNAPDTVIYYHTHHYIELNQYLVPELTNDFASWVKNSMDNQVLGERLANVSIIEFSNLSSFRDKVVNIIETYLAQDSSQHYVLSGREFYFMKSVDVILPTSYVARDLREFVEALRRITSGSLYFHVFESRLRLNKNSDDFAVWLAEDMDEQELSQEIARIDPYTYTLEGLRSLLIQIIEKHIK